MRDRALKAFARWHAVHPWRMMAIVVVLTVIFFGLATKLSVTTRWSDLLPSGDRRTIQFNKIIEEFVTSTSIIIVVQGEEQRVKQFADDLAPRLLTAVDTSKNASSLKEMAKKVERIKKLSSEKGRGPEIAKLRQEIDELRDRVSKKLIQRVDYKAEIDFLRNHGLMLVKEDDWENTKDVFKDPNLTGLLFNINNSMEKEYVGRSESMSTREKEDETWVFLDGIQNLVQLMQSYAQGEKVPAADAHNAVDRLLLGEPYLLSYDKKALILNAIPNFTMMDADLLVSGTDVIQAIVDDLLRDYPDIQAGLTGMIPVGHDEMVYSTKSLEWTSIIAFIAILVLLIVSLRMWIAPVLALFNLLIGIVWAIGTAALLVGQLNIMTQMMAVILLGLGIDFSIHIISGFTEWRAAGDNISTALEKTFLKNGKGVITGALTTAFAFLTLVISSSRGMKEMGLVTGFGLLAILLATILLLPSMLVLKERLLHWIRTKRGATTQPVKRDISFRFLGHVSQRLSKKYLFTILASIFVTVLLLWSATDISFDQNYMNIEAKGLTSIVLQDTVLDKFDLSMDYALILADDVEQSRQFAKKYREMGSVALTEDISLYLPSREQQQKHIPHIEEVRRELQSARVRPEILPSEISTLAKEIERLEMNIMEVQDLAFIGGHDKVDAKCGKILGDPQKPESKNIFRDLLQRLKSEPSTAAERLSVLQRQFGPYFKESAIRMCSTKLISLQDLPTSILDRYSNKGRDQFLVTVFPAGNIWQDAQFLKHFVDDLERVTDKATGMPPVFRALIEIIGRDGRNAVLLTLVIIFLLLLLDFGSPRYALFAMIPLAAGMIWMVGLMHLFDMQLTVMNVMGLPMILGIGIDDGVHIVHRWQHEGSGKTKLVFSSTGKAILLTSLTTMLAFGSLTFSVWRGFAQLGGALFIGVAACFLTTVIILPGIIGASERQRQATKTDDSENDASLTN